MNEESMKQYLDELIEKGLLEAIGDGISIQDTNFKILYQNSKHISFVGEHIGEYCYQAYEKSDDVCEGCPLLITFNDGLSHTSERTAPIDGEISFFEITTSPLKGKTGDIIAGIEVVRDINDRKRAEQLLQQERNKTQNYLEIAGVIIVAIDSFQTVTLINKKGCEVLEYDKDDIIGKNWFDNCVPERMREEVKIVFQSLLSGEIAPVESFENPIVTKSGIERIIAWHNTVLRDSEGNITGTLSSGEDITERKLSEKEREHLLIELEKKNKELQQVLYITSHDLRSPLVNIEGFSRELDYSLKALMSSLEGKNVPAGLRDKIAPILKRDIPESLQFIHKSIVKMESLLKGLLNLSRLGMSELTIDEINMNELLDDIVTIHEFRLSEAGAKTEISDLPKSRGDKTQINQLFSNLMDNAIKYLDPERPGDIRISGHVIEDESLYCIEDNGVGIAPEHHEKIFEIFQQLEPDKVIGEGLGLTIVNRIVERLRGRIWVESELGKGSKFFISIPS